MFCGRCLLSQEDKPAPLSHEERYGSFRAYSPASCLVPLPSILHPESRVRLLKHESDRLSLPCLQNCYKIFSTPPNLLPIIVPTSLTSSPALSSLLTSLWPHLLSHCFTDVPRSLPAQVLCTCCPHCLGCYSSRCLQSLLLLIWSHLECHLHREALQSCSFTSLSFTLITTFITSQYLSGYLVVYFPSPVRRLAP